MTDFLLALADIALIWVGILATILVVVFAATSLEDNDSELGWIAAFTAVFACCAFAAVAVVPGL